MLVTSFEAVWAASCAARLKIYSETLSASLLEGKEVSSLICTRSPSDIVSINTGSNINNECSSTFCAKARGISGTYTEDKSAKVSAEEKRERGENADEVLERRACVCGYMIIGNY